MSEEDMDTYYTYHYVERIVDAWHQATGAHKDNVREVLIKAALAINASPYTVALVFEELLPLVKENVKGPAMEVSPLTGELIRSREEAKGHEPYPYCCMWHWPVPERNSR